jgi:hypothetical protein
VLVYLTTNQQWLKLLPCKCLEYRRGGAYWRQDESGIRFTHKFVKRTQIANPERTQSEPRASAKFLKRAQNTPRANTGSEPGIRSGFVRVLGCVRSVLYIAMFHRYLHIVFLSQADLITQACSTYIFFNLRYFIDKQVQFTWISTISCIYSFSQMWLF